MKTGNNKFFGDGMFEVNLH